MGAQDVTLCKNTPKGESAHEFAKLMSEGKADENQHIPSAGCICHHPK
jgi:hypothetical protein